MNAPPVLKFIKVFCRDLQGKHENAVFLNADLIVKIELAADQPRTLWSDAAPNEYGFYSNVNPDVSHPRWSQASERRIGESDRRPTLMFNGYADQVASLYTGMDLRANY